MGYGPDPPPPPATNAFAPNPAPARALALAPLAADMPAGHLPLSLSLPLSHNPHHHPHPQSQPQSMLLLQHQHQHQLQQHHQHHHHHHIHKNNDYFTFEYDINEATVAARNLLTKGLIQDEISQCSGAAISTRGRYMPKNDHSKTPNDRPLYLFIQGPTKQSVEAAINKIDEYIRTDVGGPICRSGFNRSNNDSLQSENKPPILTISSNMTQVEKLFIGLDNLPTSFDLRGKIIGQAGSNLNYIRSETGAAVTLRGRGSQFIDSQLGHEALEPMHLFIEHTRSDGLVAARQLAVNLIETLVLELQQAMPDNQQQQQQANMSSGQQIMNLPPRIIGLPPLSVPPPQQQFNPVPTVQQPQNIEQPMLINSNPSDSVQGQLQHMRNQQIQHVQQMNQQQQQVILQQPPPLARAPIVSIPPPGIHIPQHPGPMVPPPQIVQLSAPPPTAASTGNVLVVAPPPTQSLYLPPDMGASSSIGTFSFLQGGVLYHQAPPIQTQAQIGDGLHIISAPSQATVENVNISMNSHSQPPPQMIITQVQIEPNNQIVTQGGGEQITHTFQQPAVSQQQKTQFHLIGHMQGAISQDQTTMQQQSQSIIQQTREIQNVDNFSHFSISSQTSTPTSLVFTLPYHMTVSANTSCTTTIPMSQSQIHHITGPPSQNIQIHQSEQEHILKQLPRQIMHTGFLPPQQRQARNDHGTISVQIPSNQIQTSQPPNAQTTLEHIIFTQPPNTQAIINQIPHVPPSQLITTQMPPTNTFLTNQHMQNPLMGNQSNSVMVPQQDLNQLANISQQMSQLPPIPPNQLQQSQLSMTAITPNQLPPTQMPPTHLPPNQILNQDQHNQQQINMQQSLQPQIQRQQQNHHQFNQMFDHSAVRQESRMQDIQGRNRASQVGRVRKLSRNNRQGSYPWNKNDIDKSSPNWGKRDVERNFDYDRKHDEYSSDSRLRYQQTSNNQDNDRGQYENEKSNTNVNMPAGNQRYQQYDNDNKSHDSSQNSWNRDKSDSDDTTSDSGRKRKYEEGSKWNRSEDLDSQTTENESDNTGTKRRFDKDVSWSSRSETQKSSSALDSSTTVHKSRFEPEDSNKIDSGSQQKQNTGRTSSAKTFGPNDPTKPDKETASKWSDQSGEISRAGDSMEKHLFDDDNPGLTDTSNKNEQGSLQPQSDLEKHIDQSSAAMTDRVRNQINQLNQKQVTSWCEQRSDFKGNLQYAVAGQYPGSNNMNDGEKQYNPNIQPGYMNNVQVFQSGIPYLLPPPPPPPPHTQQQQQQQQHNIQFNLNQCSNSGHITTAPPSIAMASIPQSMSQNMSLSQSIPPNIVSSMSSHLVPNVPPNMNQNVPFDISQNMIGNMSQTNTNQNIMSQNVQNMPPNSMHIQNASSMGQILPSSMAQSVVSNIGQNLPPNMIQTYMPQSMPSNVPQTVTQHMGQSMPNMMGQSITSSANQNIAQNMPPFNQNIPPNMSSMIGTNTTNVTHTIPMIMSNNLGQNVSMMQSVVGQLPLNVGPSMVPPPPSMCLHGTVPQSLPNMIPPPTMPPNMANNRPQMSTQQSMSAVPPPPPPPSVHTITSQPPYPYWMG
ncbi:uncharacterized protein LOC143911058 isoform X2 [Arctopsyche grandis]|uniref:uncharacterized protein LOC143911058 isoform X2 n=1 Tax=Arctopsyche grandis TaxID=121162 RepID=UPI00406D90F2